VGQAQQAVDPPQPVASAIAVNAPTNAVPAAGNAPAMGTTIGESPKARAEPAVPSVGERNAAAAQGAKDAVPAKPTPSANNVEGGATNQSGSPDDPSSAPAPNGSAPQQGQAQANNAAAVPAQANGTAAANTDQATPRADALAAPAVPNTAGSSGVQTGSSSVKADTGGLPNFGFAAANASTPSAAVATPATTTAAATVPIAGLAVAITARAQAGSNQFDIRLAPPELGRIDVRLDVDRDGHVTSHVTVDRADTLQLLQSQQPQLERALEQAGLKTADNGLQFTLRDQSFTGQNSGGGGQSSAAQLVFPDADQAPIQTTQIYSRAGLGSGIDIRV